MKKILSILALTTAMVTSVSAFHTGMTAGTSGEKMVPGQMMEALLSLKQKLSGKTLELPASLEKEEVSLKVRLFRLIGEALRDCAKLNFKEGSAAMKKYEEAAQKVEDAADALENLPANKSLKKKFTEERFDEMMNLMADKKQFKARLLREIAKQIDDEKLAKVADKFAEKAEKFKTMLAESKESSTDESSTDTERTGCPPVDESDDSGDASIKISKEAPQGEEASEETPSEETPSEETPSEKTETTSEATSEEEPVMTLKEDKE